MIQIIKKGIIYGFLSGFYSGSLSCFIIPNKIKIIKYTNEKKIFHITSNFYFPFIGGFIGIGSFLCSPLLFANFIFDGTYLDKLYDRINEKYLIQVKRYHQYGVNDNKYDYPSLITIEIKEVIKFNKFVKHEKVK